jgi:outer membrane protein OmpA-like peptidoglycan-associated protein
MDLEKWGAEITKDNRIRFKSPDILFRAGSSQISREFQNILKDLFPRYIAILTSPKYVDEIDEIRVEGHTSYGWGRAKDFDYIYKKNMELSQKRASSVLKFCYSLKSVRESREWIIDKFRANGISFAKPIKLPDGEMDYDKSRRVEIAVTTKATEKIYRIIEELN